MRLHAQEPYLRFEKKYIISKANGDSTDPNADYFILRLDKDPNARTALVAYANSVRNCNRGGSIEGA